MDIRIILLACLCVVTKVHAVGVGETCDATTLLCTDTDNVCQESVCKVKPTGACTGTDATNCVKLTTCSNSQCTCITPGSKVVGDVCMQVYDATCTVATVAADCTTPLPNSECTGEPLKCKCVAGYKMSSATPPTCMSVIGSTCTANADCSGVTDAECPTGATRTCTCKAGYMGATGATACTKRKIADTCENDGDCSVAVPNSYCHDDSGTKKCMCSNGYEGAAAAVTCAQIYDKTCSDDAGCTGLQYGKCKSTKCACNDDAVLEMNVCKLQIGKDCAGDYICPSNSACTGGKCTCSSNYVEKEDKCEATNSGMAVMASLMPIITALASVLLR